MPLRPIRSTLLNEKYGLDPRAWCVDFLSKLSTHQEHTLSSLHKLVLEFTNAYRTLITRDYYFREQFLSQIRAKLLVENPLNQAHELLVNINKLGYRTQQAQQLAHDYTHKTPPQRKKEQFHHYIREKEQIQQSKTLLTQQVLSDLTDWTQKLHAILQQVPDNQYNFSTSEFQERFNL